MCQRAEQEAATPREAECEAAYAEGWDACRKACDREIGALIAKYKRCDKAAKGDDLHICLVAAIRALKDIRDAVREVKHGV